MALDFTCKVCGRENGCAIQLNLYRLATRHPDYHTSAWAWGELRARWNGRAPR
jgi:hypothetical protein